MGDQRSRQGLWAALMAMVSVQAGAAMASDLFDQVSPPAVLVVRQGLAAVTLLAWTRPRWRRLEREQWQAAFGFGTVMSAMSLSMYEAIDRIPLGLAVSIELCGPIGVAIATSRRVVDLSWAVVAAIGLVLLRAGSVGGGELDGTFFALAAAAGWAGYLLMAQRIGERFDGQEGLALGVTVAACWTAPVALVGDVSPLAEPGIATRAAAVAVLSALVPFTLDLRAIRILGARMVSLLLALSPVIASGVALALLGQQLSQREMVGVVAVVVAAGGAFRMGTPESVSEDLRSATPTASGRRHPGRRAAAHDTGDQRLRS